MHAVVRTDRMYATDNRSGLVSVRFKPNGAVAEIDNGNVVRLGSLENHDTREVFVGETPSASDRLSDIALIASTEVMYSKKDRDLSDFYNKAGNLSRGYRLHFNDIFSVTEGAFCSIPAVGDIVELTSGTKLNPVKTATGATIVGRIIDTNIAGGYLYYVVKVIGEDGNNEATIESLRELANALGGDASECTTVTEVLNVISTTLGGSGDAQTNAEAIDDIAQVATPPLVITDFSFFHYNGARLDLLGRIDTSHGTNFFHMLTGCGKYLTSIPKMNTSNGTNFGYMFNGCNKITSTPEIDTSNGTSFDSMFLGCSGLTSVSGLNTSKGTDFYLMFSQCSSLSSVSGLDTSNGTKLDGLFTETAIKTNPIINTSSAQSVSAMFSGCRSLMSVSGLDTSNATNFWSMFRNCTSLEKIDGIDLGKATNTTHMFTGCSKLTHLKLYNIRSSLTIASDASFGHLLTVESLVHIIKELCKVTSSATLSMGNANINKIANLYCKVIDNTTEKIEMELCENNDEGAITITDYAALKNWTFA